MHVASATNQNSGHAYARKLRSTTVGLLCGASLVMLSLPVGAEVSAPSMRPPATGKSLAPVGKCIQVIPSVSGRLTSSYIRNVCKTGTVDVHFCYHTLKRPFEAFDALSCALGHFGSTGPIQPGQKQPITFVPASIMTFPCPYPDGVLDLGAGAGKLIPVTGRAPFTCRAR